MATKQADKFANKFFGTVTESAANTLTFKEIQTNVDIMTKRAWVLHRLEWSLLSAEIVKIAADDDTIEAALVSSDKITALGLDNPAVIDRLDIGRFIATSGGQLVFKPFVRDFAALPGGGLIITPRPLFVAVKGTSLASALTVSCRGYYTSMELSADEYLELVDFYRIVS